MADNKAKTGNIMLNIERKDLEVAKFIALPREDWSALN